jgi:hypothetical protein
MRILWIGPNYRFRYNRHHESLPDAVSELSDLIRYGPGMGNGEPCRYNGDSLYVPKLEKLYGKVDAVVAQHIRHCAHFKDWDKVSALKVAVLVDYFPRNYEAKNAFLNEGRFDIACFPEQRMVRVANKAKAFGKLPKYLKAVWLPFWADTDVFAPMNLPKIWDLMTLFSDDALGSYPNRAKVYWTLLASPYKVFARRLTSSSGKIVGAPYVRLINSSRLAVTSNDAWQSTNFKHFEYAACGTPMITEKAEDFKALGFKPGEHYINYAYTDQLAELIEVSMMHLKSIKSIGEAAMELVRGRHTVTHRAQFFLDLLSSSI